MKIDHSSKLRLNSGEIYKIFMTTSPDGAETICIGAAAVVQNVGHATQRAFMPGESAQLDQLSEFVDLELISVHSHLDAFGRLDGYQPVFTGVTVVRDQQGAFSSAIAALSAALGNNSIFGG